MSDLKNLIHELNNAFDQFRNTQEKRLDDFANDVASIHGRIDTLELNRNVQGMNAMSPIPEGEDTAYRKAYFNYIMRGEGGLSGELRNALSVGSDPDGGFWVPASTLNLIITRVHEKSNIRKLASVDSIETDRAEIPKDINEGTSGGWVGETDSRSDTETPEVGMHNIFLHEQYAMPKATQKWLDDVGIDGAENWLVKKISDKLVKDENTAFISGDGIKRPRGFTDYSVSTDEDADRTWGYLQYVPTGSSGSFKATGSAPADCLKNVVFKLQEEYHTEAVWAMNRFTMALVATLKDGDGRYLLGTAKLQDGTPFELSGYPVAMVPGMPDVAADSLSIAFGSFKEAYQILDHKRGMTILRDPFTAKPYVRFYTTKRTGGDVVNFDALKFVKFSAS